MYWTEARISVLKNKVEDVDQLNKEYNFLKENTGKEHIENVGNHKRTKPLNNRHTCGRRIINQCHIPDLQQDHGIKLRIDTPLQIQAHRVQNR